jgi:hypothetical protein
MAEAPKVEGAADGSPLRSVSGATAASVKDGATALASVTGTTPVCNSAERKIARARACLLAAAELLMDMNPP